VRHDDQFAIHDGTLRASVGEGEAAVFFHHGMVPEDFAIRVIGREQALSTHGIDRAGLGVDRGRGAGVAGVNDIAEVIVVAVGPEDFAGFGIEAVNAFLHIRAAAFVAHHEQLAVGDDGGRLSRDIGNPERLAPFFGQAFLVTAAILIGASPAEPAVNGVGCARGLSG